MLHRLNIQEKNDHVVMIIRIYCLYQRIQPIRYGLFIVMMVHMMMVAMVVVPIMLWEDH